MVCTDVRKEKLGKPRDGSVQGLNTFGWGGRGWKIGTNACTFQLLEVTEEKTAQKKATKNKKKKKKKKTQME